MNLPHGANNQHNGRITFPHRGGPPKMAPPEGWHVDPDDDYIWIQDYKPCRFMSALKMVKCERSGTLRPHDFCELLKMKINPAVCFTCTKREEPCSKNLTTNQEA